MVKRLASCEPGALYFPFGTREHAGAIRYSRTEVCLFLDGFVFGVRE